MTLRCALPNTGTTTNPYRYTGQQFDTSTGLYSLRARYYNPALGRFLSGDTYPVNYGNPVELNRYVYTANNPINAMDPSGHLLVELKIQIAKIGAVTPVVYSLGTRAYTMLAYYVSKLAPYNADDIMDFVSIVQFADTLLESGGAGGWGGGGGGGDGGDDGWDDPEIPEPGDQGEGRETGPAPKNAVGIYEYRDLTRGGKWYVGSASRESLFQRLDAERRQGRFANWSNATWTKLTLTGFGRGPILIAEQIRIEQMAEMEGGRQNLANDPYTNPAKPSVVQLFFDDAGYEAIPDWPDWLTINPYE